MIVRCCVCNDEVIIDIDEYIEDDEVFCENCYNAAIDWINELQLRRN